MVLPKVPANKAGSEKRRNGQGTDNKGKEKKPSPSRWKPGQSGNPKGRPKEGQSWKAVWKVVTELTPAEIVAGLESGDLVHAFKKMPQNVQMKYLIALRSMTALMFDPQASMLNAIMDREDGKVSDKLEMQSEIRVEGFEAILEKVYGNYKKPETN